MPDAATVLGEMAADLELRSMGENPPLSAADRAMFRLRAESCRRMQDEAMEQERNNEVARRLVSLMAAKGGTN
jgi:hypothetical protein